MNGATIKILLDGANVGAGESITTHNHHGHTRLKDCRSREVEHAAFNLPFPNEISADQKLKSLLERGTGDLVTPLVELLARDLIWTGDAHHLALGLYGVLPDRPLDPRDGFHVACL